MTPEESRENLQKNVAALKAAADAAAAKAASATGSGDEKGKEPKEDKSASAKDAAEATEKARQLSEKCMKAIGDLHDHVHSTANDDHFTAEKKAAVHKAYKAAKSAHNKLWDKQDDGEGADGDPDKPKDDETAKALKALRAEHDALKAAVLRPASGNGAGLSGDLSRGGEPPVPRVSRETEAALKGMGAGVDALAALKRAQGYAMSDRDFRATGNEVLKGLDELSAVKAA